MPSTKHSQTSKPNPSFLSFLLKALALTFAAAIFFLLLAAAAAILFQLCIARAALRRRRDRSCAGAGDERRSSDLSISKLHRERYTVRSEIEECAVCLCTLREKEWCRFLPGCRHVFHMDCVDRWLVRAPFCPICRRRVISEGEILPRDEEIEFCDDL